MRSYISKHSHAPEGGDSHGQEKSSSKKARQEKEEVTRSPGGEINSAPNSHPLPSGAGFCFSAPDSYDQASPGRLRA
jgi:hypothetical protein